MERWEKYKGKEVNEEEGKAGKQDQVIIRGKEKR